MDCIVSHIIYGEELTFEDWEKGDVGNSYTLNPNVGVITAEGMSPPSSHGEVGYRYLDVTGCVMIDYILGNAHTQYRIAFEIDTDYDDSHDLVSFSTANTALPEARSPKLFLTFSDGVLIIDEGVSEITSIHTFPNPVRTEAAIQFQLNNPQTISIQVYDIRGRKCVELNDVTLPQGEHQIPLDFRNLVNGVYLLRMQAGSYTTTHKMLHLR